MRIEKKTWPEYFQLILDGKKTYDLRMADFECREGDVLVLREWNPETKEYTGRILEKEVTFVGKINGMSFWKKEDLEKHGLQCMALKSESEGISKEIFEKEIAICKRHYQKKQCCAWGKCENCAAPLLLQKLYNGEIIEEKEAVKKFKNDALL
ncbi:MAG: hypothetical protein ACD_56C00159G0013 [uncultured bacterium]|nr:MAG: hypothetical protein ACD_56C00159G0013 [uncultured bacterium]